MPFDALAPDFDRLKKARRVDPRTSFELVGSFAANALEVLAEHTEVQPLLWKGGGGKRYHVHTAIGKPLPFSRPVNEGLFEPDPHTFAALWDQLLTALLEGELSGSKQAPVEGNLIDTAVYSAVIGYAAAVDVFNPGNKGGPGSFLEMVVGPALAILTGRRETGPLRLKIDDSNEYVTVPVDLTFVDKNEAVDLVVPTKISSRERISQTQVHQRILDAIKPGRYRSILCAANENNVMAGKGVPKASRTADKCFARDTLVPGTIALYQRYVGKLSGIYYLDPPSEYITRKYPNLPPVGTFGTLLTADLPGLLKIE